MRNAEFGHRLRGLRLAQGMGLKKLAPELGVSYTYLSKIENSKAVPSPALLDRMTEYFKEDSDERLILAERDPEDIRQILRERPRGALDYLRERFSDGGSPPKSS